MARKDLKQAGAAIAGLFLLYLLYRGVTKTSRQQQSTQQAITQSTTIGTVTSYFGLGQSYTYNTPYLQQGTLNPDKMLVRSINPLTGALTTYQISKAQFDSLSSAQKLALAEGKFRIEGGYLVVMSAAEAWLRYF